MIRWFAGTPNRIHQPRTALIGIFEETRSRPKVAVAGARPPLFTVNAPKSPNKYFPFAPRFGGVLMDYKENNIPERGVEVSLPLLFFN